jgi:hypothetical protein
VPSGSWGGRGLSLGGEVTVTGPTDGATAPPEGANVDYPQALAGLRPRLLSDVQKLAGARILDGQFTGVQQAIGTPKARAAGAEHLRAFVEEVKASGLVAEAISRNGAAGVSVAPPASARP